MRSSRLTIVGGVCALTLATGVPARALSLEQALARAALERPEIAVVPLGIRAGEGRIRQASVGPQPELDAEARNALEETSLGISLVREGGGKRDARVAAARTELALFEAQAQVRRLDIGRQVRQAYTAVLAAERSLRLTEDALALARSFSDTVAEKVSAGAASPIEQTRAAVRLHGVSAELERARREVALARADLALAVGDPGVGTEPLDGALPEDTTIPDLAALVAQAPDQPDLRLLQREALVLTGALGLARAESALDVTWRAAATHNRLDRESWVTVGVSVPLPSRDRNRGNLAAATAELERAQLELVSSGRRLSAEVARAHAALAASAREAAALRDDVLAGAEQAFATVQEGYRLGKFPYLDVLDASQVLLDARLQHTTALAALAQARIDLGRLLGVTTVPSATTQH